MAQNDNSAFAFTSTPAFSASTQRPGPQPSTNAPTFSNCCSSRPTAPPKGLRKDKSADGLLRTLLMHLGWELLSSLLPGNWRELAVETEAGADCPSTV